MRCCFCCKLIFRTSYPQVTSRWFLSTISFLSTIIFLSNIRFLCTIRLFGLFNRRFFQALTAYTGLFFFLNGERTRFNVKTPACFLTSRDSTVRLLVTTWTSMSSGYSSNFCYCGVSLLVCLSIPRNNLFDCAMTTRTYPTVIFTGCATR